MSLHNISAFSILLPLIAGVFFFFQFKKNQHLVFYFLISTIFQALLFILATHGIKNIWLINIAHLCIAVYFGAIVYHYIKPRIHKKTISYISLIYLTIIIILNSYFNWQSLHKISYLSNNLYVVVFACIALNTLLKQSTDGTFFNEPISWIVIASLFYYICSTLIFSTLEIGLLDKESQLILVYSYFHPFINIFTNLLYTFAFIYPWNKQIRSSL